MFYNQNKPEDIKEALWWEETCLGRQGGYDLDKSNLPATLKWLPKGAPLAFVKDTGKVIVCKTVKVVEKAEANATTLKVEHNDLLVIGNTIAGSEISKIETADGVDTLTVSALAKAVEAGDVIDDGNAKNVIGLNKDTNKYPLTEDTNPSVTPTLRALEIEEDSLPYPVNTDIKAALNENGIHKFKIQ